MHPGRYLFLVFLLFVQAPLVFAESDIPGWGKVKWGMTYAEVNKIYELNQWEPGKIPTSKMKKKVKIMGHDFAVAFYFDERSNNGILYKVEGRACECLQRVAQGHRPKLAMDGRQRERK